MSLYLTAVRNPLLASLSNHLDGYPTPINLSYLWGFGSIAGIALVTQIVTGVLLAMHYAPEIHYAFTSVEHIMRDVRGGTVLRYIHANGASMFFIVVYIHMFRGLYYGSYFQPRANLWYSGIVIFFLMMATGFLGYVLPWGQMSFWGATVITNLFSAIPGIGNSIVQLLWGGFSVDNPTLNRFFSLHYLLPFLIVGVVLLHLVLLHQHGSNNPLGVTSIFDRVPFYPYFYVKDLFGFLIFVLVFSFFVIYAPNYLGHPDNYIEANPLVTPAHIVPEWYFLPFYAILRTIPDKLGGVVLMGFAIAIIAFLPMVDTSAFRSNFFKPMNIWLFWYFLADSVSLGWIGQEIVESPFIEMANFVTVSYFLYFIPLLPFLGYLENRAISWGIRYYNYNLSDVALKATSSKFRGLIVGLPGFFETMNFGFQSSSEWWFDFVAGNQLFSLFIITLSLLLITSFLPRQADSLALLHRIGFGYFGLNFILATLDRPIRFDNYEIVKEAPWCLNDLNGDDSSGIPLFKDWFIEELINTVPVDISELTAYSVVQRDPALFHLFFIFFTLILVAFFYGTMDRFILQNGEELEFPILVVFIAGSALILFYVHTLIEFMLALETLTLASYVCAGYERQNRHSTYASVQYFILGSIPSGMLILGLGFLYSQTGVLTIEDLDLLLSSSEQSAFSFLKSTVDLIEDDLNIPIFEEIPDFLSPIERAFLSSFDWTIFKDGTQSLLIENKQAYEDLLKMSADLFADYYDHSQDVIYLQHVLKIMDLNLTEVEFNLESISFKTPTLLAAILFILFNLWFKLTAAPFHFWAPSVYKYAPIVTVTYISIISKAMVIFLLFKFSLTLFVPFTILLTPLFLGVALLSVFVGLVGALAEPFVKPFFVYSSMGHVGFMLAGLSLFTLTGFSATFHYLGVYIISSYMMWFILLHAGRDTRYLISFKSLRKGDPVVALIFAFLIFSMSGIPPLGGFFIKLDILAALLENSRFGINIILFFFTVATFFYYLKINKILFFESAYDFVKRYEVDSGRLQLFALFFLFLLFYMFLVQTSLYEIGRDFFVESL